MRTWRFLGALVLGLSACGGAADSGDGGVADAGIPTACPASDATQSVASAAGTYTVDACASPAPPVRGENAFAFAITTAAGAPATGLTVSVQPWMPDMGHGSPTTPTVTDLGNGVYQVTNVVFQMGGLWQLRTTLTGSSESSASDSAIVQFTID